MNRFRAANGTQGAGEGLDLGPGNGSPAPRFADSASPLMKSVTGVRDWRSMTAEWVAPLGRDLGSRL